MIMRVRLGLLKEYINENYAWILEEGRVEDAKAKYPNVSDPDFKKVVDGQPSGSNNKYLFWALKQVTAGATADAALQSVSAFETNKQRLEKKDINQYETVEDVNAAVEKLGTSKGQIAKKAASDTDVIYQDERFLVVRPFTKEASCKYGVGTQWCIAATASKNYFESYSEGNHKFYFVIDKMGTPKSPQSKYAIAIIATAGNTTQVYDASDKLVPLSTVEKLVGPKWSEIWEKILQHLKVNHTTREVELAQKAVEDQVKMLIAGEPVTEEVIRKIVAKAKLTKEVVAGLIKYLDAHPSANMSYGIDYTVINAFSTRIETMASDAAILAIQYCSSARLKMSGIGEIGLQTYFDYPLEMMLKNAQLRPQDFEELIKTNDELVLASIVENPTAPKDVKDKIIASVDQFKQSRQRQKIIVQMFLNGSITIQQARVEMPKVKGEILRQAPDMKISPEIISMIPCTSIYDLHNYLRFPNITPELTVNAISNVLKANSGADKSDVYLFVKNNKFGQDVIEKLWASEKQLRPALLQNSEIGVDNLKKFALSKNSTYRFSVAHNVTTPAEELDILSNDESVSTRAAVGANKNTKPATLKLLAGDEAVAVRTAVAGNASTALDVLVAMKKDSDSNVKKIVNGSIKKRQTTESAIRMILNSGSLMIEALSDDDEVTNDYMSPSWRNMPSLGVITNFKNFVCIYLLQNNGHATREEIIDAYDDWSNTRGSGAKTLRNYEGNSLDDTPWWSNQGTKKGAMIHLTPVGANVAQSALSKLRDAMAGKPQERVVNAHAARKGAKYFTQAATTALDVTGYEDYYVQKFEAMADADGMPLKAADGSFKSKYSVRNYRGPEVQVYSATPFKENGRGDLKGVKYMRTMNYVQVPKNAEVTYIRTNHATRDIGYAPGNSAIVKYGDKSVIVPLPLWAASEGAVPAGPQPGELGKVKMSPPAKSLARKPVTPPTPAPARTPAATTTDDAPVQTAAPVRRGAKSTYKIYGKFKGHPAATRLKGQAYVGAADTQFKSGEQAIIEPEDGKLRVKKTTGDHSQLWDPIDG